jgi:glycerol-1-phosphate dehydrogenase [NAD(P)+]
MDDLVTSPNPTDDIDKIGALLRGAYRDSQTGKPVSIATRSLVIVPSLAGMQAELIAELGLGRHLAIISDPTTYAVSASAIEHELSASQVTSVVLPDRPEADLETVATIRAATASCDALIAVGSGTINDLVKYASALDRKPYAVFATAPSMNGYTSLTAAITEHRHKKSLPAQAPAGAFFDLSVLAAAPARMIRAGLGDSLCRTTAEADWLLAHLVLDRPFRQLPFDLLRDDEPALLDNAADLVAGDPDVMELLVRTLVLSGFGTAIIGSSEPASQGEHLVSHFIDMFQSPSRPPVFHGEQIGVTTLSMARLQEEMLESVPILEADTETYGSFAERYGTELAASCWEEFEGKRLDAERADALNARITEQWPDVREKIEAILLPSQRLSAILAAAGAPLTPEEIHLDRAFYENALLRGREIRNRYTFLDLAANSGRLAGLVSTL